MAVSSVFSGNLWRQAAKDFHDLKFFVIFRTDANKLIFLVIYSKVVHLTDQNDRPIKRFSGQMVILARNCPLTSLSFWAPTQSVVINNRDWLP